MIIRCSGSGSARSDLASSFCGSFWPRGSLFGPRPVVRAPIRTFPTKPRKRQPSLGDDQTATPSEPSAYVHQQTSANDRGRPGSAARTDEVARPRSGHEYPVPRGARKGPDWSGHSLKFGFFAAFGVFLFYLILSVFVGILVLILAASNTFDINSLLPG